MMTAPTCVQLHNSPIQGADAYNLTPHGLQGTFDRARAASQPALMVLLHEGRIASVYGVDADFDTETPIVFGCQIVREIVFIALEQTSAAEAWIVLQAALYFNG